MPLTPSGVTALVEVAMSYVEAAVGAITPALSDQIRLALKEYIRGAATYDECQAVFLATIHRDKPLVRIQEILSVRDEPLPFIPESSEDDPPLLIRRRTRPWTAGEDERLLAGILRYGLDNWQQVAHFVGSGRNRAQCSQRWARGLNPRICKSAWSVEEDQQLHALVEQFGEKSWAKIASIIGHRSDVQCRYRYRQTAAAEREEANIPLMRKSKLTASTNLFEPVRKPLPKPPPEPEPSPEPEIEETPITLAQSRSCVSTPMLMTGLPPKKQPLLLPLSPLRDHTRPILSEPRREQHPTPRVKWAVVGSDPDSLNSFLKHFQ
jgi:hypothetical protein